MAAAVAAGGATEGAIFGIRGLRGSSVAKPTSAGAERNGRGENQDGAAEGGAATRRESEDGAEREGGE